MFIYISDWFERVGVQQLLHQPCPLRLPLSNLQVRIGGGSSMVSTSGGSPPMTLGQKQYSKNDKRSNIKVNKWKEEFISRI